MKFKKVRIRIVKRICTRNWVCVLPIETKDYIYVCFYRKLITVIIQNIFNVCISLTIKMIFLRGCNVFLG